MNDPELMKFLDDLINVFNPANNEIGRRALVILERLKKPTPTGETVRVRAGVYVAPMTGNMSVFGDEDGVLPMHGGRLLMATIEADIPLPRIPVVEARVVEGGEA